MGLGAWGKVVSLFCAIKNVLELEVKFAQPCEYAKNELYTVKGSTLWHGDYISIKRLFYFLKARGSGREE